MSTETVELDGHIVDSLLLAKVLDLILEAEGDSPNRYKLSKQADVLMLFYLLSAEDLAALFERLGYRYDREMIPRNVAYYANRTAHGSTLSRVVHSWVLARSDRPRSWALLCEALESDIADIQGGTTAEGIHLGAMAGTVDLVQRAYTGLETRGDVLRLNPCLPEPLQQLHLHLSYRGQALELEVRRERVRLRSLPSGAPPIRLAARDREVELNAGQERQLEVERETTAGARAGVRSEVSCSDPDPRRRAHRRG